MFSFWSVVVSWPIRLVFRMVTVLMVASLAMSNSEFCASVFETQVGKWTHAMFVTEWQSEDSSVATLYYKKKFFNTNNLFKFRITLCNISTALQEHFSTVLNVSCLIPMISSKNCHNVSTALQLCGYPPRSVAAATNPSLTPWTGKKSSTGLPLVESNLLCSRSGVSEILQRFFKKRGVHVCFKPHRTLRQRLVRPKDEIVAAEKFGDIYNIRCKDCDAEYIGETATKLGTKAKWPKWTPEISARLRSQVWCVWTR